MADLVGDDVLQQHAHECVGQREPARARVERRGLREVPGVLQVLHVLIELDVRVQDLARTRVVHVRAGRVLGGGRQPPDHGVACVLG